MGNDKPLDVFGKFLMERVRDSVYDDMRRIVRGEFKADGEQRIHQLAKELAPDEDQMTSIDKVVLRAIDLTIFSLLTSIEQARDCDVTFSCQSGSANLREDSDGLAGELFGAGWLARFSKYPHSLK